MDHADRDAVASRLLRFSDEVGSEWPMVFDLLTLHPELRRKVVRTLAEIESATYAARLADQPACVPTSRNPSPLPHRTCAVRWSAFA